MAGKMTINWIFGGIGFALTLIVSFSHNVFTTSLIRSCIASVIWFCLAYVIRWVMGLAQADSSPQKLSTDLTPDNDIRGSLVDLTTPDEGDSISELLKPSEFAQRGEHQGTSVFEPLNPPRLVKTTDRDPEELARAVRHLTEE